MPIMTPNLLILSYTLYIDDLAKDDGISTINALEILQSSTMPSIYPWLSARLWHLHSGLILGLRPTNERRRYKLAGRKPRTSPVISDALWIPKSCTKPTIYTIINTFFL